MRRLSLLKQEAVTTVSCIKFSKPFFSERVWLMSRVCTLAKVLGECIALWGKPNELSIQYRIYIFMQYVDS